MSDLETARAVEAARLLTDALERCPAAIDFRSMAFRALRDGATADAATWTADAAHAVFTATPGLAERMTFAFVLQVLGAQLVGMVAGEIPMHEAGEDGLHN